MRCDREAFFLFCTDPVSCEKLGKADYEFFTAGPQIGGKDIHKEHSDRLSTSCRDNELGPVLLFISLSTTFFFLFSFSDKKKKIANYYYSQLLLQ